MRKKLKNLSLIFILGFSIFCFLEPVLAIDLSESKSKITCDIINKEEIIYINGDTDRYFIGDDFWTQNQALISKDSVVKYWEIESGLLSECTSASAWNRISSYSPGANEHVIAVGANCTFKKPTDKTKNKLQFVFNIRYFDISNSGNYSGKLNYYSSSDDFRNGKVKSKTFSNVGFVNSRLHGTECLNISLEYCGDGIINGNEQCDFNDPSKPWITQNKSCDSSCKLTQICDANGVVEEGEMCDPLDFENKLGWGDAGCDEACNPKNADDGQCYSFTLNPTSGYIPATSVWTLVGSGAVSKYNVNGGNGEKTTGDFNATKTATGTFTYTTIGNYTAIGIVYSTNSGSTVCPANPTFNATTPSCNANGIVEEGEKCDPLDFGNKLNWGNAGCDETCNPKNIDDGQCYSFTLNPTSGYIPATPVWTLVGSGVVSKYNVDGGNGEKTTGDFNATKTATGTFTYTTVGNYTAKGIVYSTNDGSTICPTNATFSATAPSCGNGIKEVGESCDPADPNRSGWGNKGCDSQCNPINETTSSSSSSGGSSSGGSSSGGSSSGGGSSGGSSGGGGGGGGSYCGDGRVQRPNSNLEMEECDFGSSTWPVWCTNNCKINNLTFPHDGAIELGPKGEVVIGDNMNPYEEYVLTPYIMNKTNSDLYLGAFWGVEQLCVYKKGTPLAITGNNVCTNITSGGLSGVIERNSTISFSPRPNYVGNIDLLGSQTYVDNYLITTLGKNNSHYNCETGSCWFDGALKVRVSKPTVGTTGGGSSYLASSDDVSNIKDVSLTNNDGDKNFVGPSIGTDGLSSTTTTSTNTSKAQAEGDKYNTSANAGDTIGATATITSTNLGDFQNYNGLPNVFILKNKNFSITSSIFNSLSNSTTYIIEDGDLTVNADITYPDNINIAFVIKGGNVEISKDVKNLRGIFITISKGSIGGQILGVGGKTTETLNVNGSLYGNVENLVSQRTYVKQNANGLLDVGTVVNFDSSTFRDPAPLVTLFIQEYLETMKVAQ